MARGRWAQDDEGWRSRRDRSGSRGGARWGNSGRRWDENNADAERLRKENQKLQQQLRDAKRGGTTQAASNRPDAHENVPRPAAREGPDREGDWWCVHCNFRTNRHARSHCYRCAVSRSFSMLAKSNAASTAIDIGGGAPQAAASLQSTPSSTSSPAAGPPQPAPVGPEAAKAIRQRITALEAARGALAACAGCEADRGRIEQDLAAARMSLAAHLPVEVAVKCTLGTATQARAAVAKAEAKVARLELQLTGIVEQYEGAVAELSASRSRLAEAEAATAKAASVALPPEHYLAAVATDPGPFWTAFKSVIIQKCPGLPAEFLGQLDNVTKAFEAVIEPIFHPVNTQADDAAAAARASSVLPPTATSPMDAAQTRAETQGQPAPVAPPQLLSAPAAPTSAEDAIAWQRQHAGGQPALPTAQEQSLAPTSTPSASAADAARAILAATAAAAAAPVDGAPLDRDDVGGVLHSGGGGAPNVPGPTNDSMGGGAADGIVNKRGIAEVAATARAIAAKAKAKSTPAQP